MAINDEISPELASPPPLVSRYEGLQLKEPQSREPDVVEDDLVPLEKEKRPPEHTRQDGDAVSSPPDTIPALQAVGGRPRYLGQIFDTYILCELDDSFVVVDQHAVQERLIFENLKHQYEKKAVARQALLFPDLLELTAVESQVIDQYGSEIQRLGLEIKEFGGDSYMISAVPAPMGHLPPAEVLRGIISQFSGELEAAGSRPTRMENILAVMACKAAVKAGNSLQPQEAEALLEQMWQAGIFSHCPHGRPVARVIPRDEVKKWFLRT